MQDIPVLPGRVALVVQPFCSEWNATSRISGWELLDIIEDYTPDSKVDHYSFEQATNPDLQYLEPDVPTIEPKTETQVSLHWRSLGLVN